MTIEARACSKTGAMLRAALCVVQNREDLNFYADPGAAIRKMPTPSGSPVNILLFHEKNRSGDFRGCTLYRDAAVDDLHYSARW